MMTGQPREALIDELLRLEPELMRARFSVQPPPLLEIDVTMLQFKALLIMFSSTSGGDPHGMRVSDLARCLSVSAPTASTMVDRLVDRGLVERREDPQDRRQHLCRTSEEGQQLIVRFFEATRSQSRELMSLLSEQELEAVIETTNILISAANRMRMAAGLSLSETCVITDLTTQLEQSDMAVSATEPVRA